MNSKKPIAVIMAVAMTAASLSAVSLYADDAPYGSVPLGSSKIDVDYFDNYNNDIVPLVDAPTEEEDSSGTTTTTTASSDAGSSSDSDVSSDADSSDTSPSNSEEDVEPPVETVYFRDLSAGFVKGYIDMQDAPSSIGGTSIEDFINNMKCVSITGEDISGNNNNLQIYLDIIVDDMKKIKNTQKAYALLFKFDKESTITTTNGYSISTTDRNDGEQWKAEHANGDNYQYIVVWLNATVKDNTIVFQEEKEVEGKKVKTLQTVKITRDDVTPIDPNETTPAETTAEDVTLNKSELSVDKPIKTTIKEESDRDLSDYSLRVRSNNEEFLNNSKKYPMLYNAIKDGDAFTYNLILKKDGKEKEIDGDFYVTMSTENLKSAKKVYIYEYVGGVYFLIDIVEPKSNLAEFSLEELGTTVILSSVDLDNEAAETTTAPGGTGSGTASPLITAVGNSALGGSEIQVYGNNVVLPNGTKLQILAMDTAQSNNKAVELAISEGRAFAYDISIVKADGTAISTNGIKAISVTIPVPESLKDSSPIYVYRRESNDTFTNMNASLSNGKLSFVTQHLSTYVISSVALGADIVNPGSGGSSTTTTKKPGGGNSGGNSGGNGGGSVSVGGGNKNENENVNTGFLFALVPVGLAAAGIAIARKKKR